MFFMLDSNDVSISFTEQSLVKIMKCHVVQSMAIHRLALSCRSEGGLWALRELRQALQLFIASGRFPTRFLFRSSGPQIRTYPTASAHFFQKLLIVACLRLFVCLLWGLFLT